MAECFPARHCRQRARLKGIDMLTRTERGIVILLTLLLVAASAQARPAHDPPLTPVASETESVGILIPLYSYPSDSASWVAVISAKKANSSVPVAAIINPDSGPGSAIDPNYVRGTAQLKAAGITAFGYIHTSYGKASIASLEAQMSQCAQWYGPSGMFFDEMANTPGFESYYATLTRYAKSLGMTITIGNPGTDTIPSYIGTVNTLVIYEKSGYPSFDFLSGGWHALYSPSNFAFIAYGVSSLNKATAQRDARRVRYEYITDQVEPNPYSAFPPYLASEVSNLALP